MRILAGASRDVAFEHDVRCVSVNERRTHGLLQRDGRRYVYRLTDKGTRVALLFVLFHQPVCGPLANSLFHRSPLRTANPISKLAYHKADRSIEQIIQLLAA